jgi:hypothetical protein
MDKRGALARRNKQSSAIESDSRVVGVLMILAFLAVDNAGRKAFRHVIGCEVSEPMIRLCFVQDAFDKGLQHPARLPLIGLGHLEIGVRPLNYVGDVDSLAHGD